MLAAASLLPLLLLAMQDTQTTHETYAVSAAGSPRKLVIDNVSGSIHVTGYAGSSIQLTVERETRADSGEALAEAKRDVKLDISQQGNAVRIYENGPFRENGMHSQRDGYTVTFHYEVQVPFDTELVLKTLVHGDIAVRGTSAGFELRNLNGAVALDGVSGSGSVSTLNGPITAHFAKNPAAATSFKTLNGQVEVYFQPGLSADMRFQRFNGQVYTDFEVAALPTPVNLAENAGGKFRYRSNGAAYGRVGSGGLQLSFETFNGNIRLHANR